MVVLIMALNISELNGEIPVLDLVQVASLREAIGGESELAQELLDTFTAECEPALERLSAACASRNRRAIQELAHFMAGSSANLGLQRFSQACRRAEEAILDGDLVRPDLPKHLGALYHEGVQATRLEFHLN